MRFRHSSRKKLGKICHFNNRKNVIYYRQMTIHVKTIGSKSIIRQKKNQTFCMQFCVEMTKRQIGLKVSATTKTKPTAKNFLATKIY